MSERELVAALWAELAAIEPARRCCRAAERAGLGVAAHGRARTPAIGRLAVRLGDTSASDDFDWESAATHCRTAYLRGKRESLYRFMRDNSIPTDALESGKRKVLLVDDDADLVESTAKLLEEDGRFEVRIAANGFDAGMMVKEYRPDIMLLDVMLPDINGKEVCMRVRSDPSLEEVRIICISGMVEEDKIMELRLAGADDFERKPFDIEILIDKMCKLLDMESAMVA